MSRSNWSLTTLAVVLATAAVLGGVAYTQADNDIAAFAALLAGGAAVATLIIGRQASAAASASQSELARADERGGERFRAVIDNAHDAIIAIDQRGVVETFNKAAERIFGYQPDEVVGRNVSMLMPEPYRSAHDGYLHNYMTTGVAKIIGTGREVQAKRKNGQIFPMDLSIGEMNIGNRRGFIGIIRDISERKASEAARDDAERRVRDLTGELIHVSRLSAMGELASSLAHELNQPLTAIMNYSEAARATFVASPNRAIEFMEKAGSQAERAGQIIRRLRNFVGKGAVERAPASLNEVVKEASALATVGAQLDRIEVAFQLEATLPAIDIDRVQIQQVLVNLVRNAVDVLRDSERRFLTISTRATDDGQEVVVADTGPGISPDIAARLFEPFVTTKQQGMGIGLSISRSIVEAHGGRLWFEANPEGGAVFRFVVPSNVAKETT